MIAVVAGLLAAGAVLAAACHAAPPPERRLSPRKAPRGLRGPGVLARVGRAVRQSFPFALLDPSGDRRRGLATMAAIGLATSISPVAAVVPAAISWSLPHLRRGRRHRDERRQIANALPEAVDLLLLASRAGMSLSVAHPLIAPLAPQPVGKTLEAAADRAEAGEPRADALVGALSDLGGRAGALAQVLADHLRFGTPLDPALERIGFELRLDRRRHAEVAARQVPVRLLAPLVTCVLPAFGLLTVVPLLAGTLSGLPT